MTLSRAGNQICAAILLSAVLMTHGVCGRRASGAFTAAQQQRPDVQQVLLDELLTSANEDALFNELKKYHRQQPNYLAKWPGLRDLLLTADYDDTGSSESNEIMNSRFVERLRQLAASTADLEDTRDENFNAAATGDVDADALTAAAAAGSVSAGGGEQLPAGASMKKYSQSIAGPKAVFKEHGAKKNVQYMSPCHFKICNMGRKRNARYLAYNY